MYIDDLIIFITLIILNICYNFDSRIFDSNSVKIIQEYESSELKEYMSFTIIKIIDKIGFIFGAFSTMFVYNPNIKCITFMMALVFWGIIAFISIFEQTFVTFIILRFLIGFPIGVFVTHSPTIIESIAYKLINKIRESFRISLICIFYLAVPLGSGFSMILGELLINWKLSFLYSILVILCIFMLLNKYNSFLGLDSNETVKTDYKTVNKLQTNKVFILTVLGSSGVIFSLNSIIWIKQLIYDFSNIEKLLVGVILIVGGVIGSLLPICIKKLFRIDSVIKKYDAIILFVLTILTFISLTSVHLLVTVNTPLTLVLFVFAVIFGSSTFPLTTDIILYCLPREYKLTAQAVHLIFIHIFGELLYLLISSLIINMKWLTPRITCFILDFGFIPSIIAFLYIKFDIDEYYKYYT